MSSRRRTGRISGKKSSALRELKNVAKGQAKRTDQFEVEEQEAVYDEVDEKQYSKLIEERQQDGFVADDDGAGYVDIGQEEWEEEQSAAQEEDDEEASGDEAPGDKRHRGSKTAFGGISKHKRAKKSDRNQRPVTSFFGANTTSVSSAKGKKQDASADPAPRALGKESMKSLFDDFAANPMGALASSKYRKPGHGRSGGRRRADLYAKPPPKRNQDGDVVQEDAHAMEVEAAAEEADALPAPTMVKTASDAPTRELAVDEALDTRAEEAEEEDDGEEWWAATQQKMKAPEPTPGTLSPTLLRPAGGSHSPPPLGIVGPNALVGSAGLGMGMGPLPVTKIQVPASGTTPAHTKEVLRMYYMDAWEDQYQPGKVFLFGKVWVPTIRQYASACAIVMGIQRSLFFLPSKRIRARAEESGAPDAHKSVMEEINEIFRSKGIKQRRFKLCKRKYAFEELDVPREETTWVKAQYDFTSPALSPDLRGATFSKVFGTTTTGLEHLIIKRRLMGPGWIEIEKPTVKASPISWCKYDVVVETPKHISPLPDSELDAALDARALMHRSPPLKVMSLHVQTVANHQTNSNDIVIASAVVHPDVSQDGMTPGTEGEGRDFVIEGLYKFTAMRPLDGQQFPAEFKRMMDQEIRTGRRSVEVLDSERALLNYLITKIHQVDPDVIVGHNFVGYDLDILLHRMAARNVGMWSRLGRLRRQQMPKLQSGAGGTGDSTWAERQVTSGRVVCDTYLCAKDLIREQQYSLSHLSKVLLGREKEDIEMDEVVELFRTSTDLMRLVSNVEISAYLSMALMFKLQALPLTKQLTNIAGNLWSRSLTGARAERNEYLLLHSFHPLKYVVPDRLMPGQSNKSAAKSGDQAGAATKRKRQKPQYSGGLVLEPKKGLYDKFVLLLDFNSLYPSIIQEYNICFTSVVRPTPDADGNVPLAGIPEKPKDERSWGVLPLVIRRIVEQRKAVKQQIKAEENKREPNQGYLKQKDVRQKALKLTANSMYGCLGFTHSRFHAKPLAELITTRGREILQDTVKIAENELQMEVIYGDTDSIMVSTNSSDYEQVLKLGDMVKVAVNKKYRSLVIEIDGVYSRLLLLRKKKYAAIMVVERHISDGHGKKVRKLLSKPEVKGLDLVRRDWCQLSKDIGNFVLNQILKADEDREKVVETIHAHLRDMAAKMRNNEIPLAKYLITKSMTKAPEDYPDARHQPHVQVALRMQSEGKPVRTGDHIQYAICQQAQAKDATSKPAAPAATKETSYASHAFHPSEVMRPQSGLTLDVEWYLTQQIHPPVARLCAPIPGTNDSLLADALGLDSTKFSRSSYGGDEGGSASGEYVPQRDITDPKHFKDCSALHVLCGKCGVSMVYKGPFVPVEAQAQEASSSSSAKTTYRSGLQCQSTSCGAKIPLDRMWACVETDARRHIQRFMDGWRVCNDRSCQNRTRQVSLLTNGHGCIVQGCTGVAEEEYSGSQLYHQLSYYRLLFDVDLHLNLIDGDIAKVGARDAVAGDRAVFNALRSRADALRNRSEYNTVHLGQVFKMMITSARMRSAAQKSQQ